jgi:hypothetical protein
MQVDHYFDDATAANDGHHKFVHLPTQGADPAVSLTGVIYQKVNTAANPRLYYRAKTGAGVTRNPEQIPTAVTNSITLAAPQTTATIIDFTGFPAFNGTYIGANAALSSYSSAELIFNGTTLVALNGARAGDILTIFADGARLRCTKNAVAITVVYTVIKAEV